MANPLINNQINNVTDIKGMFQEFKKDPVQALIKAKFKIPDTVGSEPQAIVQHLLNSGQITQQQVNAARSQLQMFR